MTPRVPKEEYNRKHPCSVMRCTNPTSERKPYCIDHLERLPYAKNVIAENEEREDLELSVAKGGEVSPGSSIAHDILVTLNGANRPIGIDHIVHHSRMPYEVAIKAALALDRIGSLHVYYDKRQLVVAKLSEDDGRGRGVILPLEIKVTGDRSLIGLVQARPTNEGMTVIPIPYEVSMVPGVRRVELLSVYATALPFTKLLNPFQVRAVLLALQGRRAETIPDKYWCSDRGIREKAKADLRLHGFYSE